MTRPDADQLDHLIGHTDHRALTPTEHAALRAGVQQLRDSRAEHTEADRDAAIERAELLQTQAWDYRQRILDIDAHATPYGVRTDDPDGNPRAYLVTVGSLHRALGTVGHTAPKCDAEARAERYRSAWHSARDRAARATGTLDGVQANLALLHQGEEPHIDEATVPTPAQWIWQWNRATPAKRLEVVGKILGDANHRYDCFMNNWPERARQAEAEIMTARAALDEVARELNGWASDDITAGHVVRRVRGAMDGAAPTQERPGHADQNARSMLLNLLAGWGMRSGHGARAIVDEALRRHASEVAEVVPRSVTAAAVAVPADTPAPEQQIITLPPKPTPPGPMLAQPCTTDRDLSSFEGLGALADTVAAMARSEAAQREAKISAALAENGFTVVRTDPVEEVAAEPRTVSRLLAEFRATPDVGDLATWSAADLQGRTMDSLSLVTDESLPAGEVHLRPHTRVATQ